MKITKWVWFWMLTLVAWGCANITVNVYFPSDKEVEDAYDDIEEILDEEIERGQAKTTSRLRVRLAPATAYADDDDKNPLMREVKKMKDVVAAIERRRERRVRLFELSNAGVIGLLRSGQLAVLPLELRTDTAAQVLAENLGDADDDTGVAKLVSDENEDRSILIRGMALARFRAGGKDDPVDEELKEEIEKERHLFWKNRRKRLDVGMYYQNPEVQWVKVPAKTEP